MAATRDEIGTSYPDYHHYDQSRSDMTTTTKTDAPTSTVAETLAALGRGERYDPADAERAFPPGHA